LKKSGFSLIEILNPIETRERRKKRIRKVKNDRLDSSEIAKLIKQRQGKTSFYPSEELRKLRSLTRFSEKLKTQEKFLKREIVNLLERIWPEFEGFFSSSLFLATPLMILRNLEKLKRIIKENQRRRFSPCFKEKFPFKNLSGKSQRNPFFLQEFYWPGIKR